MDARSLESQMDATVGTMRAASAGLLRSIVAYDRARCWKADGATSMSAWLAARYQEPRSTTAEWVRVAWALEELPHISGSYARCRLSWGQVRFVTRFASHDDDGEWAERACSMSPAELLYEAQRRERVNARRAHEAHRRRGLTTWWDEETSMFNLHARYGADQGARVERELARRAERTPKDEDAESPGRARMADALFGCADAGVEFRFPTRPGGARHSCGRRRPRGYATFASWKGEGRTTGVDPDVAARNGGHQARRGRGRTQAGYGNGAAARLRRERRSGAGAGGAAGRGRAYGAARAAVVAASAGPSGPGGMPVPRV